MYSWGILKQNCAHQKCTNSGSIHSSGKQSIQSYDWDEFVLTWDLCSSGTLCSTDWLVVSNVLGQTAWTSKMVPTDCPTTLVHNYQSMLLNNPEERTSHLHRGWSPKSGVLKRHSMSRQVWDLHLSVSHSWSAFKAKCF